MLTTLPSVSASELAALEEEARARLDPAAYDYIAGAAEDELTMTANMAAWSALAIRPHVLRDVGTVDTSTSLLGIPVVAPIVVAPSAMHGLVCAEAEAATARAAAEFGTIMTLSLAANLSLEEVAAVTPSSPRWFQTYMHRDRGFTRELVQRARDAGYTAIVLTVDSPVLSKRSRDIRNALVPPAHLRVPNMPPPPSGDAPEADLMALAAAFDPSVTFDDLSLPTEWCGLPVVVKGLVRGDDARRSIEHGAAGVVVSNHGGRQLDSTIATARALAEVVDAVGGSAPVLVDGGVRSGTDVLRALALGADAVLVGRPILWGLATGGEQGAGAVLRMLGDELSRAMAFCGATRISEIHRDLLDVDPRTGRPLP
jgi:4-hydroxymandelate oxidase